MCYLHYHCTSVWSSCIQHSASLHLISWTAAISIPYISNSVFCSCNVPAPYRLEHIPSSNTEMTVIICFRIKWSFVSPWGWQMLLTETCQRNNNAHVNQRMAVFYFCYLNDDKVRVRQSGSINAVPSLKSTVPELMSHFQQHFVELNWRLFEVYYTLQWRQTLVSDLIKQHKMYTVNVKNLPHNSPAYFFECVFVASGSVFTGRSWQ